MNIIIAIDTSMVMIRMTMMMIKVCNYIHLFSSRVCSGLFARWFLQAKYHHHHHHHHQFRERNALRYHSAVISRDLDWHPFYQAIGDKGFRLSEIFDWSCYNENPLSLHWHGPRLFRWPGKSRRQAIYFSFVKTFIFLRHMIYKFYFHGLRDHETH